MGAGARRRRRPRARALAGRAQRTRAAWAAAWERRPATHAQHASRAVVDVPDREPLPAGYSGVSVYRRCVLDVFPAHGPGLNGVRRLTLHDCRHTFASFAIAAGVNAKALSTYMGHSSVSITLNRYGHMMPGNEAVAAEMLDRYLKPAVVTG